MTRWRTPLALLATVMLVVACGGGVPVPGSTDDLGDFTFPPFQGPTGRPSGAQIRVFNAYSPASGPAPIDVYGDTFVDEGSAPLVRAQYGILTEFYDPTAMDDEGNGFLSFYPRDLQGSDDQLMSQTFTLKPGQMYTVFLLTAGTLDGGLGISTHTFLHDPEPDGLSNTPSPGNGLLVVISTGLDAILPDVADQSWYVSFGNGCEPGLGNEPGGGITTTVSPGQTGAFYELPPGLTTVSIHPQGSTEAPDCSTSPITLGQIDVKADVTYVMPLFSPEDAELQSIIVPLEP